MEGQSFKQQNKEAAIVQDDIAAFLYKIASVAGDAGGTQIPLRKPNIPPSLG